MSVIEKNKIDGIGKSKDNKKIVMMISDHMNWDNEYEHLIILQDKINAYIHFIENGQVAQMYPNFNEYVIMIYFKIKISEKCWQFIQTVNYQLKSDKIQIEIKEEEEG